MKKVVFGSSLFIGGILLLMLTSMPYWTLDHLMLRNSFFYFLFTVIPLAIIITGLIIGIKGLKEDK